MAALSFLMFLTSTHKLSEELLEQLAIMAKPETYQNHQVLLTAGQVENRVWYVEEGMIRSYYFDHTGKEHTLQFYLPGDLIFSWQGIYREPTEHYLEALANSRLVSLSYASLRTVFDRFKEVKAIIPVILRQRLQSDSFYSRLMTYSAEERYRQVRKVNPAIFRHVSLRIIASYLNMTRENLSRLIAKD